MQVLRAGSAPSEYVSGSKFDSYMRMGITTPTAMHDRTAEKFDAWSHSGKAEDMEKGHGKSVSRMLASAGFEDGEQFSFLDVGCGNGWVVRKVASENPGCRRCIGIDKSQGMVRRAESHPGNPGTARYECADIERWSYRGRFDYVFAMESLYYAESIEAALARIYGLLSPGGRLLCGTDYYAENVATKRWASAMKITMHLLSKKEWLRLASEAGFTAAARHLRDPGAREAWKREMGTLFVTGVKPG